MGLALMASAEDQKPGKRRAAAGASRANTAANVKPSRQASVHQNAAVRGTSRQFNTNQNANARAFRQRGGGSTQAHAQTAVTTSNNRVHRNVARQQGFRRAQEATGNTAAVNATSNARAVRNQQRIARQREFTATSANGAATVNRTRNINRNVAVVNNWRGDRFAGQRYTAFRTYHRAWHDRGWWNTHYGTNLTFVFGAPYFWSSGYWYPAWGYNPGYVYPYDGPIYGASHLTPDQIVMNVQAQLRDDGYYDGAIDGVLGSQTRYALAAFQADHGLAVTSAVDEPTLATLGLAS